MRLSSVMTGSGATVRRPVTWVRESVKRQPRVSDGDPCTDDCDEGSDTCEQVCNADGPWDACCTSSSFCGGEPVCNEEVTLTVGDGSGARSSTGNDVIVSLANPSDQVRAVQVEICDGDDYLTVQTNCVPSGRVPVGDYACQCNELPSGCASCALSPNLGVFDNIPTGTGPLFTVKYNVSGMRPSGSAGTSRSIRREVYWC